MDEDKNEDHDDVFRDDEVEDVHEKTTDPGDRHVLAANSSDLGDRTDLVDRVDTADGVDPADEDDPEWFSDVESVSTIGSPEYSSDENRPKRKFNWFNKSTMDNPELEVGMMFKTAQQFRMALVNWNLNGGYDIDYTRNENSVSIVHVFDYLF